MVTTYTTCENCIHGKVCSIKDQVKEAKNKALEDFSDYGDLIRVSVQCTQYS